jgi:hypothetical protein
VNELEVLAAECRRLKERIAELETQKALSYSGRRWIAMNGSEKLSYPMASNSPSQS